MNLNARAPMDILEIPLLIVGHVSFHNDHYIIVNPTLVLVQCMESNAKDNFVEIN